MTTGLIICAALAREVSQIVQKHDWDVRITGVSPKDHLFPTRIAPDVERRILKMKSRFDSLAVIYGECGTNGKLDEVLERYGIRRVDALNCYEMYAGDLYHRLLDEERGTFFLTDFLVRTFHQAVIQGLGLDRYPELKSDYFHNCKRIAYLIQEDNAEMRSRAQVIADYMELPILFHFTGYSGLEDKIMELLNREEYRKGLPACNTHCSYKNIISKKLLLCC